MESTSKIKERAEKIFERIEDIRRELAKEEEALAGVMQEARSDWESKIGEMIPESLREQVWIAYAKEAGLPVDKEFHKGRTESTKIAMFSVERQNIKENPTMSLHLNHTHIRTKAPRARLDILVEEGLLAQGQTLFFRRDDGHPCPGCRYEARIRGNFIIHEDGHSYTMSRLARQLNQDFGRQDAETRGPKYWFTEDGDSILELWERYMKKKSQ